MRALRPRNPEQAVIFDGVFPPGAVTARLAKSAAWRCMDKVCAFKVSTTCGVSTQSTSEITPTIEYTRVDGAGGSDALLTAGGAAGTAPEGRSSPGSVLCSRRGVLAGRESGEAGIEGGGESGRPSDMRATKIAA